MMRAAVWLLVAVLAACSDRPEPPAEAPFDAARARRVFDPPVGEVRAVPPHAIHSAGVGPYLLGADLKQILGLLPRGPRVVLMEIDGLVDYSLVRAEDDALIIGVQRPGGVTFVAVLDDEVGRTEAGVGVGVSHEELVEALGEPVPLSRRPRDPRIVLFDRPRNTRFVMHEGRVQAVLVSGRPPADAAKAEPARDRAAGPAPTPEPVPATESKCAAIDRLGEHADEIRRVAELGADAQVAFGCLTAGGAEALVTQGDRLVVVAGEPDKLKRVASHRVEGIIFVAPVDLDGDGQEAVAVVLGRRTPGQLEVAIELLRLEGTQLSRLAGETIYRLPATSAAWIGAELADIELLIELEGQGGNVDVGGLYVHGKGSRVRTLAPLMRKTVTVRPRRAPEPSGPSRGLPATARARDDAGAVMRAVEVEDAATAPAPEQP